MRRWSKEPLERYWNVEAATVDDGLFLQGFHVAHCLGNSLPVSGALHLSLHPVQVEGGWLMSVICHAEKEKTLKKQEESGSIYENRSAKYGDF